MKMRDTIQRHVQKARSSFRQAPRVTGVVAVVLALLVLSGGAVAQQESQQILIDDFEDCDISDWNYDSDFASVVTEGAIQGDCALTTDDSNGNLASKPVQQAEYSRISFVTRAEGDQVRGDGSDSMMQYAGDGSVIARVGIGQRSAESPDRLEIVQYSGGQGDAGVGEYVPNGVAIRFSTVFNWEDDTVVHSARYYENGTLIWEGDPVAMGGTEPVEVVSYDDYLYDSAQVDLITANGTEEDLIPREPRNITIQTRDLVFPDGSTHPYDVVLEDVGEVTDESTVTSSNSTLLSVDQTNETVTSINDTNASGVVYLNATYQDGIETRTTSKRVVVAEPTVSNLELIPTGLWRTYAVMSDNTIFALIIAGFGAVAAGRFAGAFAGLATAEMVIVIGWLAGYVGLGMAMVSLFMCLFIGLNLAANIDYTVSRARR